MNDDDFFVEDVMKNLEKKKKVNSKDKGDRGERDLCKVLCGRFPNREAFFRVVGSGNRWSQVTLSEHAKEVLVGDVCAPPGFRHSIECKYGYADIELSSILLNGNKQIDVFLEKAERDAAKVGRHPLLCWRKPHYPWVVFIKRKIEPPQFHMWYKDWLVVSLDHLLTYPDEWWFA